MTHSYLLHGCSVTIKPDQFPQLRSTYHLLAHLACYWPMIWEQVLLLGQLRPQVLAVLVELLVFLKKIWIHYFKYYTFKENKMNTAFRMDLCMNTSGYTSTQRCSLRNRFPFATFLSGKSCYFLSLSLLPLNHPGRRRLCSFFIL